MRIFLTVSHKIIPSVTSTLVPQVLMRRAKADLLEKTHFTLLAEQQLSPPLLVLFLIVDFGPLHLHHSPKLGHKVD